MSGSHDGHSHNGHDDQAPTVEEPGYYQRRIQAIETLLVAKGILTHAEVQAKLEEWAAKSPADGSRVVARAWVDPEFKQRLLADAKAAAAELGIDASGGAGLIVKENTPDVHHVVVCTLCSCYPRMILGLPPDWYKSLNYRQRVVVDPRGVLREFGTELPEDAEVRVLDSTADLRYLILPVRPAGTEGWSEEALAKLVTRDTMIGVAQPVAPALAR